MMMIAAGLDKVARTPETRRVEWNHQVKEKSCTAQEGGERPSPVCCGYAGKARKVASVAALGLRLKVEPSYVVMSRTAGRG